MRSRSKVALAVVALAAATGIGFTAGQAQPRQPHMRAALDDLQAARGELQTASANKGGHRANAIRLVDQAIDETRRGMEYAD
jgi:hypothetical protein